MCADTGVHPLVMAAEKDEAVLPGKAVRRIAVISSACRAEQNTAARPGSVHAIQHGCEAQNHAGAAAVGGIVDVAKAATGKAANIRDDKIQQPQALRPLHHMCVCKRGEVLRADGADGNPHRASNHLKAGRCKTQRGA